MPSELMVQTVADASQKASNVMMKRTFADLPDEVIVAIAGWLPGKDAERHGQPVRHQPPDLANFSLANKRVRRLLVAGLLYFRYDLTRASYEHLLELTSHEEWLASIRHIHLPMFLNVASDLHIGRSAHEYDLVLASIMARTHILTAITLDMLYSNQADVLKIVHLPTTVRATTKVQTISKIVIHNLKHSLQHAHAFSFLLGVLQTWSNAEAIKRLSFSSKILIDGEAYIQLWQTVESFPCLKNVFFMMSVSDFGLDDLPRSAWLPRQNSLQVLNLKAVCGAADDDAAIELIIRMLGACPQLSRLTLDALDFIWLQQFKSLPHKICLPRLRILSLRVSSRRADHFKTTSIKALDRSDTILATSPITELQMTSVQSARLICDILRFQRVSLSHLRQLAFCSDFAKLLQAEVEGTSQSLLLDFAKHCSQRGLRRVIIHDSDYTGADGDQCSCCV